MSPVEDLLDRVGRLRADADLVDGYAGRLREIASALADCAEAPDGTGDTLERRAAACGTGGARRRPPAAPVAVHRRGGG
ncbi:hypothetical protein, partial [Streptomyces sp. IBSBF 3136]|uniref:hypothetical protein n=1 Tax=Streptomyces sp. IBSBF 3136 TaxID=2903524 RepID=UPI002FDC48D9